MDRLFAALPTAVETLSLNQYIGFLHTRVEAGPAGSLELSFHFDDPYCAYFEKHSSSWRLWLSDPFREKLGASRELSVTVDGKRVTGVRSSDFLRETLAIHLPAGWGRHVWKLGTAE